MLNIKQFTIMNTASVILAVLFIVFNINAEESYSPYTNQTFPRNVYWGDTHLHTNLSIDANNLGNKFLSPDEAYRFARGEEVVAHNGQTVRLIRPLDFLVIADHANNMGVMTAIEAGDAMLLETDLGRRWQEKLQEMQGKNFSAIIEFMLNNTFGMFSNATTVRDRAFRQSVWNTVIDKAEQYNHPGQFTTFIGYEWTPLELAKWLPVKEGDDSLSITLHHRVVLFKDGKEKVSQVLPFSRYDSEDPADLWAYLSDYQQQTRGEVIAIPHNSNLSRGQAFTPFDAKGHPLSKHYAESRSQWEPLLEVTQIKGDSETHPLLSPTDEFADFEKWQYPVRCEDEKTCRQYEYARSALNQGLKHQKALGVNPFKFGMIGSTDAHTSLATASDNNFWGKSAFGEPNKEGKHRILSSPSAPGGYSSAGYAAVWAEENTRESLFAAMKRKEVYATTGPRMTVRFFAGWDYEYDDAFKHDLAGIGYAKGVPMGGNLTHAPEDSAPRFLIRAVKDPDGANLDRAQVIKGWLDKHGELHEKIYNVVLSDGRKINGREKVQPVGNTVDVANASYTNTIGDPELSIVWQDPDFNKNELAFYYVRVIEIPTPRWTAYDAKYFGLSNIPEEVPMITQERAYTSPIWYTP